MNRIVFAIFLAVGAWLNGTLAQAENFKTFFPEIYEQVTPEFLPGVDAMDLQQGKVSLRGGIAEVNVPEGYYFLGPKDARFVLEKIWGNPEDLAILGMLFPRVASPFEDTWGVVVTFDDSGYVSDEDAASIDYDELLATMKTDTAAANEERAKAGFPKVELLGWAQKPHYDATERKLFWAKTLHFEGDEEDTLNYNIRALGRKGVLEVNFVASSDQMAAVEAAAPEVIKMVSFTDGNRYTDFSPDVDKVAAYGIAGLVAGTFASKLGLFAGLLLFLKKGIVLLLLPIGWAWNKFKNRKGRGADPEA
jgi:uncharacterized membrane-anchored protein